MVLLLQLQQADDEEGWKAKMSNLWVFKVINGD
jgi:hypothetical protein